MKEKTRLKLERRWLSLPAHHIDASVILGAFLENDEFNKECTDYLNKVGYKYRGCISTSVIGEIFMVLKDRIPDAADREFFFRFFDRLVEKNQITFSGMLFGIYEKALELRNNIYNIEPLDALHLSNAVVRKANAFVTLDEKLINSKIKSLFGITIVHSKDA